MNENDTENIDSTNDTEETVNEVELELEETEEAEEETITIPKKKWTEALAQKEHWQKKAIESKDTKEKTVTKNTDLSPIDTIAIIKAGIDTEDIADVLEYAQLKKISISEALRSPLVKGIVAEKAEQRNVAQATNTGATRRSTSRMTDDVLMDRASKGTLPESDEDMKRLWKIRTGKK